MCICHLFILENGKLLGTFSVLWGDIDQTGMGLAWPGLGVVLFYA